MLKVYQFIFISFLVSLAANIHAQTIGIRAGANLANMKISNSDPILGSDPHSKLDAHFELFGNYALNRQFSVESAIGISTKGYKVKISGIRPNSGFYYTITGRRSMSYLDIPVRLKFQNQNSTLKYFAALGPEMSIGLSGKWHTERILSEVSTIDGKQVEWNNTNDVNSLKRMDLGVFAGVGFEYNTLIVEFSYTQSLTNISATKDLGNIAQNKVFSLSVGRYLLRRVRNTTENELMGSSSHFEFIKSPKKSTKKKYPKKSSKKKKKKRKKRR